MDPVMNFKAIAQTCAIVQKSVEALDVFIAKRGKNVADWEPNDILIYIGLMAETAEQLDKVFVPIKQLE